MKMNMYQWIDEMIAADKKTALPVLSFPSIQKMNTTVNELVRDADLQAQGMKIIADLTKSAASLSYMDLSVEAEAFGSDIRYSDEEVPTVFGSIIKNMDDVNALKVPKVGDARTGACVDAIKKATAMINDRPILAGVIGPYSLAGRLLDVSTSLMLCYDEPELVHETLKKVNAFLIQYINAFKEAGANGVVMAEPLAGLLSEDLAEEFSEQYVKEIVDAVQDENFIVVYHNCGNSVIQTIDSILGSSCRMFHFGNVIDMEEMMPLIPNNCIAMGNITALRWAMSIRPDSLETAHPTAFMKQQPMF
ncbi:MAG: uroporphyrinogen decarboxylase family protein [Pseudoramibacter sp.]